MKRLHTAFAIISVIFTSCTTEKSSSPVQDSGVITYQITYTDEKNDSISARFLPQKLILSYAENKLLFNIESDLNIFSINISSPGTIDSSYINMHFMGKDFSYKIAASELLFLYDTLSKPEIELHKEDSCMIAGLTCYKAIIRVKDRPAYNVYYTDELPIENPNRHTPLSSIPGLLMSFPIQYNGINFNFNAVTFEKLNKTKWKNQKYCINSTNKEVEELIKSLISVFQ